MDNILKTIAGKRFATFNEAADCVCDPLVKIKNGMKQLKVLVYLAIKLHEEGVSPLHDPDVSGGGAPTLMGNDMPYSSYPCMENELYGWPVNVAFYRGVPYIHSKYLGLELSGHDSDDNLAPFIIPDHEVCGNSSSSDRGGIKFADGTIFTWTREDSLSDIRGVLFMIYNMLCFGACADTILGRLKEESDARVSPFIKVQNLHHLPIHTVPVEGMLVKPDVVQRVLQSGYFEALESSCFINAMIIHEANVMKRMRLDVDVPYVSTKRIRVV